MAGAVAAVWAAFPNKTGKQIVQRILDIARQMDTANGNYGQMTKLSSVYGHGALDLGAAMNPVGFTSMSTHGSGKIPVRRSFVSLPPGFRRRPTAALRNAIVHDTQMFPFLHDLNGVIRTPRALSTISCRRPTTAGRRGTSAAGSRWSSHGRSRTAPIGRRRCTIAAFAWRRRQLFRFGSAGGGGARGASNDFVARRLGRGLLRDGFVVEPFTELAGGGAVLGVDWRRSERTRLDFVGKAGSGYFGGGRARLASFGVTAGSGPA